MMSLKFSFVFLFVFGFLYLVSGNPISNFFGKSDDKVEEDKTTVGVAKPAGETTTTTTTPEPSSSCGGLKGFLHICDKNVVTEPPKSVKTRSVSEEDDSDEDETDESESKEEDDNSDEKTNVEEEKQQPTETSPVSSEPTEREIAKRQVGDPEAPVLGETPPVVQDAMELPNKPEGDDVEKRGIDQSESDSDEDDQSSDENIRKRRDCRDREEDYGKDCRKKREYVPPCFGSHCKQNETTDATK